LHEAAYVGIIVSGAVVVETGFSIEAAAGELVGIGMVGIRSRHLAVDAVFVGLDGIARRIAQGHHGAQAVEVIVVDGIAVLDVYHTERLVNARAVDVFTHQVVTVVVFGYNVAAVIEVFGGNAVDSL
jgi:hypothetical protein